MATIRTTDDLPEWFKTENYDSCAKLTPREWLYELEVRCDFYTCPITCCFTKEHHGPLRSWCDSRTEEHAEAVKKSAETFSNCLSWERGEVVFTGPVSGVSAPEVTSVAQIAEIHDLKQATASQQEMGVKFLAVDILCPDDVLKEKFAEWLTDCRRQYPPKLTKGELAGHKQPISNEGIRTFTEADFQSWYDQGLLPYLDLAQWAAIYKHKITRDTMGKAILPGANQGDRGERVRKVTKITARDVTHWFVLKTLRSQVVGRCSLKDKNGRIQA